MALCEMHPHGDLFVDLNNAYDDHMMWRTLKIRRMLTINFVRMNLITETHLMTSLVVMMMNRETLKGLEKVTRN